MCQEELEAHDGVQPGKYTVGLGQRCMAFCGDQEDVVSMGLTAVHCLLEKYDVDPKSIGRHAVRIFAWLMRIQSCSMRPPTRLHLHASRCGAGGWL